METHIYQIGSDVTSQGVYLGNHLGTPGADAFARLSWNAETGLQLTMWRYETTLDDGWLSCCINCHPRYRYKGFLSIEFRADGTCRCSFGPDKLNRIAFPALGVPMPMLQISHIIRDGGPCWMGQVQIPRKTLNKLYGIPCNLQSGHKLRGNFYSFSESYWCSWAPVSQPEPHMDEYFGLLEIL